jgi:hypothetical protein
MDGQRMVDGWLTTSFFRQNGMFDYMEFTRILKHGAQDKEEA